MEDLSLHILDIAENSIAAGADKIQIKIIEDIKKNLLTIEIADNGRGMDPETVKMASDPFFTTKVKKKKFGLGIPLLAQAAKECNGDISIASEEGRGTAITARFEYDHIDKKPLGDIASTLSILIASHPLIDFVFEHSRGERNYSINTLEIRKDLEDIPINNPEVIKFIKESISEWLNDSKSIMLE